MTQLTLRLFGQPRLEQNGQPVAIKSRKGMALLAYMATRKQPAGRDMVATMLWPEFNQTRSRANLRRTLYTLNQTVLASWLRSEGERLTLDLAEGDLIDVRRFEELNAEATPEALAEAAALYISEFLTGFHLPDSEPFDEWLTLQRQSLQRSALETLDQLVEYHLENEALDLAEEYARRQLEIDNLREPAWRQLMIVLDQSGRRSEALVEFGKCRQILWDELGVEPAAETIVLASEIRSLSPSTTSDESDRDVTLAESRLATSNASLDFSLASSPYRGLYAFREKDAPFFFGREEFTDLLIASISHQSILAVIGPSGSGKSSVVYAGLLARLKETTNWVIASFRPGQRPMHALAASLVPKLDESLGETERLEETNRLVSAFESGDVTLYDVVERIRLKQQSERLILVADQFEELYTLVQETDRRHRFLDVLLELVFMQQYRPAPVFTLVLTLRADFLGQALAYRLTADAMQEADVKLGPMTEVELKRAVALPAQKLGVSFEEGLVARILGDVGHEPGNLPLLEFALSTLWDQQSAGRLTHSAYEAIGRVEGALARYADGMYSSLSTTEQAQAKRVFIQLVRPGEGTEDTRRLATRAELDDDWLLVHRLADARLVVTGHDPSGGDTVEIIHEALIQKWGRFREWMADDRDFRLWQERLRVAVRDWQSHDRDESGLLRGVSLSTAEDWRAKRPNDLSQIERKYIAAGVDLRLRREEEATRQRAERERLRRRFTWALVVGLLLAMILASVAFVQWLGASRDRDAARVALAQQLAAQSQAAINTNYDRALLLAVEAVRMADDGQTKQSLREVLGYSPNLGRFLHLPETTYSEITRAGLRTDGLMALGDGQSITLWDLHAGQPAVRYEIESASDARSPIVFSPDGTMLATFAILEEPRDSEQEPMIGSPRAVEIYDLSDGTLLQVIPVDLFANTMIFSPDSSSLATIGLSRAQIWDVQNGRQMQELINVELTSANFSPNGRLLAGGSVEGQLLVWDLYSGEIVEDLPAHEEEISTTVFSPNGRFLVTAATDGTIRFWQTASWSPVTDPLQAHSGTFMITFAPDGLTIATAGEDGLLRRWAVGEGRSLGQSFNGHQPGTIFGLSYSPEGDELLSGMIIEAAEGQWPQIIVWRPEQAPVNWLVGHEDMILAAAFGPEEEMITSVSADGVIANWTTSGKWLGSSAATDWTVECCGGGLSPDGRWIARGSRLGPVVIYNGATGERSHVLDEPPMPIASFTFTADSKWLAGAGCAEGTLLPQRCDSGQTWIWEVETGNIVGFSAFDDSDMVHNDVAISTDGRLAASGTFVIGGGESRIVLWDVGSGRLLAEQEARSTGDLNLFGLAFSPNSELLTGNGVAGFTIWDIGEGGQLSERLTMQDLSNVTRAAFSSDGRWLATGRTNGAVSIWDAGNGFRLVHEEMAHDEDVTSLLFSDDGAFLLSGSQDGSQVLYDMPQLVDTPQGTGSAAVEAACARANRNLTQVEWQRYFGSEPYRQTCPQSENVMPSRR